VATPAAQTGPLDTDSRWGTGCWPTAPSASYRLQPSIWSCNYTRINVRLHKGSLSDARPTGLYRDIIRICHIRLEALIRALPRSNPSRYLLFPHLDRSPLGGPTCGTLSHILLHSCYYDNHSCIQHHYQLSMSLSTQDCIQEHQYKVTTQGSS